MVAEAEQGTVGAEAGRGSQMSGGIEQPDQPTPGRKIMEQRVGPTPRRGGSTTTKLARLDRLRRAPYRLDLPLPQRLERGPPL